MLPERPKPKRLKPGRTHRKALLDSLPDEQRAVAEQVLRGGVPAVREALKEQNEKLKAEGKPPIKPEGVVSLAEDLLPRLRVAEWLDRAEAALADLDELDLRDLRSVVAASGDSVVARDESTRELAEKLRDGLSVRQDKEHQEWLADIDAALGVGRVVRALRLSSRPPKAGVRFPTELGTRLAEAAGAALTADAAPDRWGAVLEAVAYSPVRGQRDAGRLPRDGDRRAEGPGEAPRRAGARDRQALRHRASPPGARAPRQVRRPPGPRKPKPPPPPPGHGQGRQAARRGEGTGQPPKPMRRRRPSPRPPSRTSSRRTSLRPRRRPSRTEAVDTAAPTPEASTEARRAATESPGRRGAWRTPTHRPRHRRRGQPRTPTAAAEAPTPAPSARPRASGSRAGSRRSRRPATERQPSTPRADRSADADARRHDRQRRPPAASRRPRRERTPATAEPTTQPRRLQAAEPATAEAPADENATEAPAGDESSTGDTSA